MIDRNPTFIWPCMMYMFDLVEPIFWSIGHTKSAPSIGQKKIIIIKGTLCTCEH